MTLIWSPQETTLILNPQESKDLAEALNYLDAITTYEVDMDSPEQARVVNFLRCVSAQLGKEAA